MTAPPRFAVLPVGGGDHAPPTADPAPAQDWWRAASGGRWRPEAVLWPPVMLDAAPARWCAGGGMGPGPRNAAALLREALLRLPPALAAGQEVPSRVVAVVAGPVAPHAWRVAGGGVALAPGRWVRRYAALPAGAPLGAWVHEMAHLLLDWPDLPGSEGLMGQGCLGEGVPAPPCPALAWAAGWLDLREAGPVGALGAGEAVSLPWQGRVLLVTRWRDRLWLHDRDRPGPALGSLAAGRPDLALLAAIAPLLTALGAPGG